MVLFQQPFQEEYRWKIQFFIQWGTFSGIVRIIDIAKYPDELSSLQGLPELLDFLFREKVSLQSV